MLKLTCCIFLTRRGMSQPSEPPASQPYLLGPRNAACFLSSVASHFLPSPGSLSSQVETAKGLGNFRKTLKPGCEPKGNSSERADAVWEMMEIWHSCGGQFLKVRGRQAGLQAPGPAATPDLCSTQRRSGREDESHWPVTQLLLWASVSRSPGVISAGR